MTGETVLLIDADILAYQHSAAAQENYDWGNGTVSVSVDDIEDVKERVRADLDALMEKLKADRFIICLTDSVNFRLSILPSYKGNRVQEKPLLLKDVKAWLAEEFPTYLRPGLEADDVMGILSTHPTLIPGKKIIVSIDKDMKQIPGWLYNPDKHTKPVLVTKEEGDHFHMVQTINGDPVDGYKGCPGAGYGIAEEMLGGALMFVKEEREITRGINKGKIKTTWNKAALAHPWETVVSIYEKAGLTEEDALVQARVAKICQWDDYDYKQKKVKLWNPKTI